MEFSEIGDIVSEVLEDDSIESEVSEDGHTEVRGFNVRYYVSLDITLKNVPIFLFVFFLVGEVYACVTKHGTQDVFCSCKVCVRICFLSLLLPDYVISAGPRVKGCDQCSGSSSA